MSKRSEKLEKELEELVNKNTGQAIPVSIPDWMITEGILAGSIIERAERKGQKNSKTDVLIRLKDSMPIKISAKLSNADYFGNWYGHRRFLREFGIDTFNKLSLEVTKWANERMKKEDENLFVGVCVSFGGRTGDTGLDFADTFKGEDVLTIAKGSGSDEESANALFVNNKCPENIEKLIGSLQEINVDNVQSAVKGFKVILRPVNPMTNKTNNSKCIYTRFQPYKRLEEKTTITSMEELRQFGKFVPVDCTVSYNLTTNKQLEILEDCFNIRIERKK